MCEFEVSMETDTARRQLTRRVWNREGRTESIVSTHGVEGWGRVTGEDKVIPHECGEGEGRGPGMTPAENCHI